MNELPRDSGGRLSKWAWPGGYPIGYAYRDHCTICPECARQSDEDPNELPSRKATNAFINWEHPDLYCEECDARIESAYAEDDHK